jgi:hypothetical protein
VGWLLPAKGGLAQASATVDVALSVVEYDGFQPSAAGAVTPALTWERPRVAIGLRGTYLRFESGNRSIQGLATGSWFTAPGRAWRGEISAQTGASSYATFSGFWHALAEARLHRPRERHGFWIAGAAGRTSFGALSQPAATLTVAGWLRRGALTAVASANRATLGDTAYSDLEATVRTARGALALEAVVGARVWSRGGGRGVYGEGSVTCTLGGHTALVVSGGRYPTDPLRGSIAGRYLSAALRMRARPERRPTNVPRPMPTGVGANGSSASAPRIDVRPSDGGVRLIVDVSGARSVDVAGDFTDWLPVALRPTADRWEGTFSVSSGTHRIAVRVDGGPWIAPAGVRHAPDDYGGAVGILVVPSP